MRISDLILQKGGLPAIHRRHILVKIQVSFQIICSPLQPSPYHEIHACAESNKKNVYEYHHYILWYYMTEAHDFSRNDDPTSPSKLEIFPIVHDYFWFWSLCWALCIVSRNNWGTRLQKSAALGLSGDHQGTIITAKCDSGFCNAPPRPEGFGIVSRPENRLETMLTSGSLA